MPVSKSIFDQATNTTLYTIANANGQLRVNIIDYGATIVNIIVPDKNNIQRDVVLGFDDLDGYQNKRLHNPFFGASVGRVANRIGNATFSLDGEKYKLFANNGVNSLHGGLNGFDKRKWEFITSDNDSSITLQYVSADGEEGYPGALQAQIRFTVTEKNELRLDYTAELVANQNGVIAPKTIVNLTNHTYFNLHGAYSVEASKILDHQVLMEAEKYLEVNDSLIPTGSCLPVKGTVMDFTRTQQPPYTIGERTEQVKPAGYDHCYVLQDNPNQFRIDPQPLAKAVQVFSPLTGIKLTMYTTEPGVQFYVGSKIPENHQPKRTQTTDSSTVKLGAYSGFCLEAQRFPDAINKKQWQSQVLLLPNKQYKQSTVYRFELSNSI